MSFIWFNLGKYPFVLVSFLLPEGSCLLRSQKPRDDDNSLTTGLENGREVKHGYKKCNYQD
jgi:hypothetical protein